VKGLVYPEDDCAQRTGMNITEIGSKRAKTEQGGRSHLRRYVVDESVIKDFVGSLEIHDVDAAAARFQAVADVTAKMLRSRANNANDIEKSDLELIKRLAARSRNRHYRRIMSAMLEAVGQGWEGITAAQKTAAHIVDMAFRWTPEYISVLYMYRDKLRRTMQATETSS
jgi:hypothetical protein